MSFLSPYCEVMIFKIASALGIEKIRKSLLWSSDWMIEENMLHASLSADRIIKVSELSIRKAEWYIDPGHSQVLYECCQKPSREFVGEVPLYTRKVYIQEAMTNGSVVMENGFKNEVLYISVPNLNMVVADCLMVDHKKKRVFLYQASVSPGKKHAFKEENIRKYIKDMHLVENNYELCLVYVRGAHHGCDTGLSFIKSDFSQSVGGLPEDLTSIVKTYVVRANYFGDRYVRRSSN